MQGGGKDDEVVMSLSPYEPRGLVSAGNDGCAASSIPDTCMQSLRIETNKGGKVSRALAALGNATVDVNQQRMTGNAIISPQQRPGDRHESVTFSSQRGSSFTQNRLARLEQLSKEKPVTAIAGVRSSTQ